MANDPYRNPERCRDDLLIETRSVVETILVDIQHEAFAVGIQGQGFPRDGEQLIPQAEYAAEGQHGIRNSAAAHIDHDVFDVSEVFTIQVDHLVALQRVRRHDFRSGAAGELMFLFNDACTAGASTALIG
ncbi:MAG: hypothetical protein K0S28_2013 [Paucimonas sp.]|nr:hypothetical protein [Paucimonas sp.]